MEFLPQQNKVNQGDTIDDQILATGKDVIVIGGGDTGSDCTAPRIARAARSLTQFELLPQPPDVGPFPRATERPASSPWPYWPMILRTSTSHEEGCERRVEHCDQGISRRRIGPRREPGHRAHRMDQGRRRTPDISRSRPAREQFWPANWCCWRWASLGPRSSGPIEQLGLELDPRGNVKCNEQYMTSVAGVFAAGDMRRGQSLVVWAIHEGREAARAVDKFLMGVSHLPSVNAGDFAWR